MLPLLVQTCVHTLAGTDMCPHPASASRRGRSEEAGSLLLILSAPDFCLHAEFATCAAVHLLHVEEHACVAVHLQLMSCPECRWLSALTYASASAAVPFEPFLA